MKAKIEINDIAVTDSADTDARVHNAEQIITANPEILDWSSRGAAIDEIAEGSGWKQIDKDIAAETETNTQLAEMLVEIRVADVGYTYDADWAGKDETATTSFSVTLGADA